MDKNLSLVNCACCCITILILLFISYYVYYIYYCIKKDEKFLGGPVSSSSGVLGSLSSGSQMRRTSHFGQPSQGAETILRPSHLLYWDDQRREGLVPYGQRPNLWSQEDVAYWDMQDEQAHDLRADAVRKANEKKMENLESYKILENIGTEGFSASDAVSVLETEQLRRKL